MLGGPIGSMFAKSIAKQTSQTLTNALNRFKGSYKDNYMEASANGGGDGGNTYSPQQPTQPQSVVEPNEIDEIFKNDDGSTTKRKTKIRQTGKKKRIEYKETISNKSQDNTLISKRGTSTNASRNQGFSSLDKNYVNSIINKKFDEKSELPGESLTRKDLAFITHLSKSIVSKMERSAEAKKDDGILKGLGEVIVSAFPSIRMMNASKYYHQLPNPAKVGVFNAMNTSIGMLYASSRSIGTETHRLLYSLIQVNKIGMGVKLKVKAPTDITTLTEFLGESIKNVVKSPFRAGRWALTGALGLGGINSGPNLGGMSGGGGGGGGRNLRSGKGLGLSLAALLGAGGTGATGAGLMGKGPMAGMMANSISPQHLALIQKLMMGAGGMGMAGLKGLGGAAMATGFPLAPVGMGLAGYAGYRALGGMARSLRTGALKNTWFGKGYQNSTIGRIHGAASKAKNFIFTNGKDKNDDEESEKGNLYSKKILNAMEIDSKRDDVFQKTTILILSKIAKFGQKEVETSIKSADEDKKANKETKNWRLFTLLAGIGSSLMGMAGGISGITTSVATVATIGVIGKAVWDWMATGDGVTTLKDSGFGAVVGGLIGGGIGLWFGSPLGMKIGAEFGAVIGAGLMAYFGDDLRILLGWKKTPATTSYQVRPDSLLIDDLVKNNFSPFTRYVPDPVENRNRHINSKNTEKGFAILWDNFRAPTDILPNGPIRSKEQIEKETRETLYGMPPLNTNSTPLSVELQSTYTRPTLAPTVTPTTPTTSSPYNALPPTTPMVTTQIPTSSLNPVVTPATPTPQAAPTTVAPASTKSLDQKIDDISRSVGGTPPGASYRSQLKSALETAKKEKWTPDQVNGQMWKIRMAIGADDTPENNKKILNAIMTEINPSSGVAPQASTKSGLTGNSGLDMVLPNLVMAAPRTMSTMNTMGTASKYDLNGYFQNVPDQYKQFVLNASEKYGVDPNLIAAVMKAESNFRPNVDSTSGAMGLMQLLKGTAGDMGLTSDFYNPEKNIDAGTKYLSKMLELTGGKVDHALGAYNAGPGNYATYGNQIPPFDETQKYVKKIMGMMGGKYSGTMGTPISPRGNSSSTGFNMLDDAPPPSSLWESGKAVASSLWNDPSTYPEREVSSFLTNLGSQAKAYSNSALDYIDSRIPSIPQTSAKSTSSKEWKRQHALAFWNMQDQASTTPLSKAEIRSKIIEYLDKNPKLKEKLESDSGLTVSQLLDAEMDGKELSSLLTGNQLSGTLKNISDAGGANGSMGDPGFNNFTASVNNLISTLSTNNSNSNVSSGGGGGNVLQDFETDRLPFDLQSLLFGDFD